MALALAAGCDGAPADGDADADADADGDGDANAETDGDVDEDSGQAGELRVMTWNIREFPLVPGSVEAAAAVIADLDVDVVAIQEVQVPSAFDELLAALPSYDGELNEDDPDAWLRVGLLWRRERVTVTDVGTIFRTDWYAFPRPPLVATVTAEARPGGEPFDFVVAVLHLKASLDDESRERRRAACERLEEWVDARMESTGEEDFVLLGDWNDELTDWGAHQVFQVFLDRPEDFTFLTLERAEAGGFTLIPFESFIDHVMVTASALDEYGAGWTEVLPLEETVDDYTAILSDHRPVLSVFEMP
jgi:endonuclease/exonuclease/phosphatase family metal-dependent hydrolase